MNKCKDCIYSIINDQGEVDLWCKKTVKMEDVTNPKRLVSITLIPQIANFKGDCAYYKYRAYRIGIA